MAGSGFCSLYISLAYIGYITQRGRSLPTAIYTGQGEDIPRLQDLEIKAVAFTYDLTVIVSGVLERVLSDVDA